MDEQPHRPASRIGFLVNPIAGMGGRVGLKGTDGVAEEAFRRGAKPVATKRAASAMAAVAAHHRKLRSPPLLQWITCSGAMGADTLREAGLENITCVYDAPGETSAADTKVAVEKILAENVDVILFCGGDGTARDICSIAGSDTPILGIPSGVKMYSGVFGVTPAKTAEVLLGFLEGKLQTSTADIVDLDEDLYRKGEWAVRLYQTAITPYEPVLAQTAKMLIDACSDADVKKEISDHMCEQIQIAPETLFLLGPGSTVQQVGRRLGFQKTLLGIDATVGGKPVAFDLNEQEILALLDKYNKRKLVLSPIGAQGFVLGRGNLQISPKVIRKIDRGNLIVLATPAKLSRTSLLRFDTGCPTLDRELGGNGYLPVITGYHRRRLVKVSI